MTDSNQSCVTYKLCDGVWAGTYPDEAAIRRLTAEGIVAYADLTRRDEQWVYRIKDYGKLLPQSTKHFRFPLWTYWLPPPARLLEIVKVVEENTPCYVHCRQGLDRTGVIAALVLMQRGLSLDEALSHLRHARGTTTPRKSYHLKYLTKIAPVLAEKTRR